MNRLMNIPAIRLGHLGRVAEKEHYSAMCSKLSGRFVGSESVDDAVIVIFGSSQWSESWDRMLEAPASLSGRGTGNGQFSPPSTYMTTYGYGGNIEDIESIAYVYAPYIPDGLDEL